MRWLRRSVLLLAAAGCAAAAVLLLRPDCSFDRQQWASARKLPTGSDARFEAIEDELRTLVECEKLDGLTPGEVRALLGRRDGSADDARYWFYETGVPAPRSDYPGLEIEFNQTGEVERARVPGVIEP